MRISRLLIPMAVVFAFALAVRLALLAAVAPALRVSEFADDALYYRELIRDPTMLITGRITEDMETGVIYAPLMPLGISFPGRWLAHLFGFPIGHRLAMIVYDTAAVVAALGIAWRATSPPKGFRDWAVALALAAVPGSAVASAVWGQEDTLNAVWAAICLLAVVGGRPVLAAAVAGFGVFTIKMFAVLLVLGIWLGSPGRRRAVAVAGAVPVVLFVIFLYLRWRLTGLAMPPPSYGGLANSPSLYSAFHHLVAPLTFTEVRPAVLAITALAMGAVSWLAVRRHIGVPAAVVAVHAAFFVAFIGIQPEHHQWFMPFLLFVAWSAFRQGERALPLAAWAFSLMAYGYKIAFGLQGGLSASSAGKDVIRAWITGYVQPALYPLQIVMLALTLLTGVALCVLSFRFGARQHRLAGALAQAQANPPAPAA